MSDKGDLFLLKEQWRLRAHVAEEKVEKLEAEVERLTALIPDVVKVFRDAADKLEAEQP